MPTAKCEIVVIEYAVTMEINLLAVAGSRCRPNSPNGSSRTTVATGRFSWCFTWPLQLANLILQLPARPFEGIVDGEVQIGMALIGLRGTVDIDLPAVRKRQTDVDLIEAACPVMTRQALSTPPGKPLRDRNAAQDLDVLGKRGLDLRPCFHALIFDFDRRLHGLTPIMCTGNARSALHCHFRFGATLFGVLGDFRHGGFRQQQDAGH